MQTKPLARAPIAAYRSPGQDRIDGHFIGFDPRVSANDNEAHSGGKAIGGRPGRISAFMTLAKQIGWRSEQLMALGGP
jgi:hypothetical protein